MPILITSIFMSSLCLSFVSLGNLMSCLIASFVCLLLLILSFLATILIFVFLSLGSRYFSSATYFMLPGVISPYL